MIKIVKGDEVELRCDSCEHADHNGMCLWPDNSGPRPCERSESREQANDVVNKPQHYTYGSVDCIDYLDGIGLGQDFCAASVIKYVTRYKMKGKPVEDLEKAAWYVNHLLEKIKEGVYSV